MGSPFIKMNGLGNDFVIVTGDMTPSAAQVRAIADRNTGIGCDQFILLGPSLRGDVAMRIWNPDGSPAERCGNAERCVAWLTMKSSGRRDAVLENNERLSYAKATAAGGVVVDMGAPGLDWRDIPLAWEMDTREIQLRLDDHLGAPGCVSMGNPHVVFFVPDIRTTPVATTGSIVEKHWLFPERVNVGIRGDSGAVEHPVAGVGARNRSDPRVRHGSMRGSGSRASARPYRKVGDDDPRRRRARD